MLIYLLLFIFYSITPLNLTELKSEHENDYTYYQIEKHGSMFKNIAHSHMIPTAAILSFGIYSLKNKSMFSLEKLPHLLIPASAAYLGERVIEFFGTRKERLAKENSSNNYNILKKCFEILEKEKEKDIDIDAEMFIEKYDQEGTSNNQYYNKKVYDEINEIIFKKKKHDQFLFPERIKKTEELYKLQIKEAKEKAEAAELERKKIEAELEEKNIVKIFEYETYNNTKEVRAFYGWEKYTEEKATAITNKIKNKEVIKENTLLYGPAGCGKTSYVENVTKAIATGLNKNVIFYNIKNADLKTKTQNSAAAHTNQLFEQVYEKAKTYPVVLFFDEFDGISTKREKHNEKKEDKIDHQNNDVTALLLQKIEEASEKKNILIFAATNHIENMDDALIRTGRFDHKIHIGKPNINMRTDIIKTIFSNSKEQKTLDEELNILLHLTSNQTTVDVANTVNQYLTFKRKENNKIKERLDINKFTINALIAQKSRKGKHIDERKITEWINKVNKNDSIDELRKAEKENPEIVSIQAIQEQEQYPSLKFDLEGIISSENINDSYEERVLTFLSHLQELKGLPSRFNLINELLEEIKAKQNNMAEDLFKIQEVQKQTKDQLSELISGANQFLKEYKEQKTEIKNIKDNLIKVSILSEEIYQTLNNLDAKTLTKEIANQLKTLMSNMLNDIEVLIKKAFVENQKEIIEKINNIQTAVNTINTFEEIKTLNGKIETICNETQQTLVAKALENKVLLNIVFIKAKEKENLFIKKTENIKWLKKEEEEEEEKEKIKKFILLITTAYDYNEYVYFLDKIFDGQDGITVQSNSLKTEKKYNEKLSNACREFNFLEPLKEKILKKNTSLSTENLPQPTSVNEVWKHLLNPDNYYEQNHLKNNLLKVKDFISKKWNSTEEFENFNVFITNFMYLSEHDQKEILKEHKYVSLIRDDLTKLDKDKIKEIISDVALNDLKNEIAYSCYYKNNAANRLKFRIKFNLEWFLNNIKE